MVVRLAPIKPKLARLRLVTLAEHYGVPQDEAIADEEWLALAGTQGWVVLMKDTRIRYNLAEREAVKQHGVRAFCLSNQNLRAQDMATRFLDNLDGIANAATEPGPLHLRGARDADRASADQRKLKSGRRTRARTLVCRSCRCAARCPCQSS